MILYSDLDGCFLDIETYSYNDTIKYAQKFIDSGNLLIFCSSKTYDEINSIMIKIDREMPYIVENGGGIYIPNKFKCWEVSSNTANVDVNLFKVSDHSFNIFKTIKYIREEIGIKMNTYQDLNINQICSITGLNKYQAALAKNRKFSETIITRLNNQEITVLESRLRQINLTCTKGSRFYTIHPNDINKGKAALILFQKIQNMRIENKLTIGIGDSYNDESLLDFTNKSYLLKNKHNEWSNIKGDNIIKIDGMGQDGWIKVYKEITKSLK